MFPTERFEDALLYATHVHRDQRRKGTRIPYVSHLMSVCAIVLEHGGDEDEAIAALLHDAPEDQGGRKTLEKIRQRFGERVATIVDECCDTYEDFKPAWRPRKERYLLRLPGASASGRLVSAADKLHNIRSILTDHRAIGPDLWGRFHAGEEEQLWYFGAVVEALRSAGDRESIADEIERALVELRASCEANPYVAPRPEDGCRRCGAPAPDEVLGVTAEQLGSQFNIPEPSYGSPGSRDTSPGSRFCDRCFQHYCNSHWVLQSYFDAGYWDGTDAICPRGHRIAAIDR